MDIVPTDGLQAEGTVQFVIEERQERAEFLGLDGVLGLQPQHFLVLPNDRFDGLPSS